jgi:hypothetical protein
MEERSSWITIFLSFSLQGVRLVPLITRIQLPTNQLLMYYSALQFLILHRRVRKIDHVVQSRQ